MGENGVAPCVYIISISIFLFLILIWNSHKHVRATLISGIFSLVCYGFFFVSGVWDVRSSAGVGVDRRELIVMTTWEAICCW